MSLFTDEQGKASSTRLALGWGLLMSGIAFLAETFFSLPVRLEYIEVSKLLIGLGLSATGLRGIAKNARSTEIQRGSDPV